MTQPDVPPKKVDPEVKTTDILKPALPVTPPAPDFSRLVPVSYDEWRKVPSPENMSKILKEINPLLQSEIGRFRGVLPESALQAQTKRQTIHAIKGYNPDKGAKLTTHIVNTLQKLYRENYKHQQSVRLSEELQRGVGQFQKLKDELTFKLQRDPTVAEIADELGWPVSKVQRIERQARGEIFGSDLEYDPAEVETDTTDPRIDLVYHDLGTTDRLIMEYSTGYGGKEIMAKKKIAEKLKISPAAVTQRSKKIAKKLMKVLNVRTAKYAR